MKNPTNQTLHKGIKILIMTKALLFLCTLSIFAANNVIAQNERVTIDFKDADIRTVLSAIEEETNLYFFYKNEELSDFDNISISSQNTPVSEVMAELFTGSGFTFQIIGNYIAIVPKTMAPAQSLQDLEINGTVLDTSGQPLPGVAIIVKNQPLTGVSSGSDGQFTIRARRGDILQFSFIGMKTVEITIMNNEPLVVRMEEDIIGLDDIIVVAYGTVKRESYTGSASVVSSQRIGEKPVSSFTQALQENATGLIVNSNGMPGSMPSVRIRGVGSMNASNAPLYVIDGVASEMSDVSQLSNISSDPMTSINPNDIESITILKDAAAASLYGSRAANGVIIITTKQGKAGKTSFEFEILRGYSQLSYTPDLTNKDEYVKLWETAELHSIMRTKAVSDKVDPYQYIKECYADPALYNTYLATARSRFNNAFKIEGQVYDFWGDGYSMYPDVNWMDEVTRTGVNDKINFSASGGNANLTYYVSGEYYNVLSPIKGAGLTRYSGRSNLTSKVNNFFWFGLNMNLSYTDQSGPQTGAMYANPVRTGAYLMPVIPVYNSDGTYNSSFPYNVLSNYNPVAIIEAAEFGTYTYRQISNAWVQFNLAKPLTFKTTFGYDVRQTDENRWYPPMIATGKSLNGVKYEYYSTRRRLTSSNILNFTETFRQKHNVNALAGFEIEHTKTRYFGGEAANYQTAFTPELSAASVIRSLTGSGTDDALISFLGKAEYNFNEKYFAAVSYRRDGSSRFSRQSRWGDFYSVSAAWRLTKEDFMNDLKWLSDAKLRTSYGINGTLPNGLYEYVGNYVFGLDYDGYSGASIMNVENLNLSWEKSRNLNLGLDLSFLRGRISTSIEYFNRYSHDLLLDRELSRVSGYTTATVNMGAMRNSGFEWSLFAEPVSGNAFNWQTILNFSTLNNKIESLPTDNITAQQIDKQGFAQQSWFLPEWAGIDTETGEPMWYNVNEETGQKSLTKNIDEATRQIFGNSMPHFHGSLNNVFNYRNFDLSFLFTFAWDFNVLDYDGALITQDDGYSRQRNKERILLDNWRPDNTDSRNPILIAGLRNGSNYSTRHIYKGDYLKLKNVRLGYNIPNNITGKIKLNSVHIYVQAENLFLKTYMNNFDPEISKNGKRYLYDYPSPRTITAGMKFRF